MATKAELQQTIRELEATIEARDREIAENDSAKELETKQDALDAAIARVSDEELTTLRAIAGALISPTYQHTRPATITRARIDLEHLLADWQRTFQSGQSEMLPRFFDRA